MIFFVNKVDYAYVHTEIPNKFWTSYGIEYNREGFIWNQSIGKGDPLVDLSVLSPNYV
jgi:hypothetical protein